MKQIVGVSKVITRNKIGYFYIFLTSRSRFSWAKFSKYNNFYPAKRLWFPESNLHVTYIVFALLEIHIAYTNSISKEVIHSIVLRIYYPRTQIDKYRFCKNISEIIKFILKCFGDKCDRKLTAIFILIYG